ncbi:MAG: hypothetical protein ACOZHQ_15035 [Thermodesulfobacteriota bacterium]
MGGGEGQGGGGSQSSDGVTANPDASTISPGSGCGKVGQHDSEQAKKKWAIGDYIQLGILFALTLTLAAAIFAAMYTKEAAEQTRRAANYYDRETRFNVNLKLNEFDRKIMEGYIGRPHVEALYMQPPAGISIEGLANMRLRIIVKGAKIDQGCQNNEDNIRSGRLAKLLNTLVFNSANIDRENHDSASNFPELVSINELEKYLYGPDYHYDRRRIVLSEANQLAEGILYLLYNAYEALQAELMTDDDFDTWMAYLGDVGDHPLFLVAIRNWHGNGACQVFCV